MKEGTRLRKNIFSNGLALTAGIALTITSYSFAKNLTMDALLFYALILIVTAFTGLVISYFAYQRLRDVYEFPMGFIVIPYAIITIEAGVLLLRGFIHFQIPYGYLFLPVTIELAGALIFMTIVHTLASRLNPATKLGLIAGLIIAASVSVLLVS